MKEAVNFDSFFFYVLTCCKMSQDFFKKLLDVFDN